MTLQESVPATLVAPELGWKAIRSHYRATSQWLYLNSCSRGLLSNAALAAGIASLEADAGVRDEHPSASRQVEETRELVSRLLHAAPGTVAVMKNVSDGLNSIRTSLDWKSGDNVVLCSDVEHPNNVYQWRQLETKGVIVKDIPSRDGLIDAGAMAAAIDGRTRVVTASAVTFQPGFRTDLAQIGSAAREHDTLFLVDGVQACGIIDIDVVKNNISALSTATNKGLLGTRGVGFLYVSPEWVERLKPTHLARNSFETVSDHNSEYEAGVLLRKDARRFECGHHNYVGIAIARAALKEILTIGVARIEDRSVKLATDLAEGLSSAGWPVVQPPEGVRRTHILTIGTRGAGNASTTGNPRLDRLAAALQEAGARFAIRNGLIRFGLNFYNNSEDLSRVLEIARDVN